MITFFECFGIEGKPYKKIPVYDYGISSSIFIAIMHDIEEKIFQMYYQVLSKLWYTVDTIICCNRCMYIFYFNCTYVVSSSQLGWMFCNFVKDITALDVLVRFCYHILLSSCSLWIIEISCRRG